MEQPPSFNENQESPEEKMIRLLIEKGFEDVEARALFQTWAAAQEEKARNAPDQALAGIELDLKIGRLYAKTNQTMAAINNFKAARKRAMFEGRGDLEEAIEAEAKDLGIILPPFEMDQDEDFDLE
jgi:hypothetical protein